MREGWEYKKFESCINKVPKAKQVKTNEYDSGTKYPIVSQEDKLISGYYDDESMVFHIDSPVVIFGDHTRVLKYVDFDFVVGADGVKIISPKDNLNAKFLLYYLIWYNIPNLGYSRHYKLLKELDIPLPPLSTQLTIVSELDKINELIRLKKEQLKDYDNLAQSIFYEMFGDPVENEKGWEVKKFSEIYKLKSGDGLSAKDFREGCIPVYGGNGISGFHDTYNMDGSFIIIGRVGVYCGNVREVSGKFWLTDNAFQLFYDNTSQYPTFIHYLLELLDLHQYANAAAQPVISNLTLKGVNIIIPPLALQQIFVSRITQIEAQKTEVQHAITDLETLLASRMQFWFDINEAADSIVNNYYSEKLIEDRYDEMFPQGHHSMEVNYGERQKCVVNDIDFKLLAQAYNHILDNGANALENINKVIYPTLDKAHFCVLVELGLIATEDYKTFNIPL